MSATVIRSDARRLPLADASVDLIVTSPPYWALRSYTDGGQHYDGQIGAEATPQAYVDSLIGCTGEWMRVLKPSGSMWVNLGDKYSGAQGQTTGATSQRHSTPEMWARTNPKNTGIPDKSLVGLPWRYAIRCIDDLGLILRAEVIWSKPNGLPESVTDRVRRSHEQWFHLVRSPRYFSAVDAIREAHAGEFLASGARNPRYGRPNGRMPSELNGTLSDPSPQRKDGGILSGIGNLSLGKLPGSVWEVATQPLKVPPHLGIDHFAAFPMEWPRRIIQGWSPSGICTTCGEGRRPVVEKTKRLLQATHNGHLWSAPISGGPLDPRPHATDATITGEACDCPDTTAPTRPAVVLDPFGGTGTVALVAAALGRRGISGDMSADYCRLARWRTTDPGQRAAALEVDKPPVQLAGQADLFDLLGA